MNPDTSGPASAPSTQPAPEPTIPQPQQPMMGSGKKMSKNVIIGVIVAAVVVVAAAAYGVFAYISNTPENLLQSAVENINKEKALAAEFKVVSGTEDNGVTFSGDIAATYDPTNNKNGEAIIGLGTGSDRISVDALSLDGTVFLRPHNFENFGALLAGFMGNSDLASPELAESFKNVNDQWFELTKEDVQSLAQTTAGTDTVSGATSPEDLKKALEIYQKQPFIVSDKVYGDEVVDGSNSAHFSIKLDKNRYVAFMKELKAANLQTIKITDADIEKAQNESETMENGAVELWIARDSRKFKQIRVINTEKGNESTITLTLISKLPTFDKFERPANAKPIAEFYTLLLGPALNGNGAALESEL